ncbi:hypothetical protein [Stenotrophomonas sp. GD03657]|jgi:hypothetical protein|uniref:hypothetical protein n=1 Tax=Stenotrophomonas sp. GD03657 TaxID=2975363 RepID=UPI002447EA8C|nr:hypothetical protein [Stenotrophomonas sp. GD03657]MDH2154277.1 hypothetical protein [Stenotrophomonas sp. GD03657]
MSTELQDQVRNQNLAVVANLTDLTSAIVQAVAGNEISNSLGGELVSGAHMRQLATAQIGLALAKQTGGL